MFVTPGAAMITHATHGDGAKPGDVIEKKCKTRGAESGKTGKSIEGLMGKNSNNSAGV